MKFSQKQNEFIRQSIHRYNLKIGAVRSGKSYVDIAYTVPSRLRKVKDEDGLNFIIGVSKETIERNVLQPMREIYTSAIVGNINSRNIAMVCGVPVYCIGAARKSQLAQIQGASIKYCYGDEIAKWDQSVFAMLQSRLDKPYSKFDGACNPEYPGHWLKEFIDRQDLDMYVQPYTIFDNPFLTTAFVENLCKEYAGTVYYDRYIMGKWALAEGLVYPMYAEAIEKPPTGPASDYRLSIDYGTMNAFAALLWELHDGVWYAVDGYYYSGRDEGVTKTDEEYGEALGDFVEETFEKYGRRIKTFIDPSAASFIALLQKSGKYRVLPAMNDVADGIRDTAVAMKKGLIKISPSIKENPGEAERPIKINDHFMDATRYFVYTEQLVPKSRRRTAQ